MVLGEHHPLSMGGASSPRQDVLARVLRECGIIGDFVSLFGVFTSWAPAKRHDRIPSCDSRDDGNGRIVRDLVVGVRLEGVSMSKRVWAEESGRSVRTKIFVLVEEDLRKVCQAAFRGEEERRAREKKNDEHASADPVLARANRLDEAVCVALEAAFFGRNVEHRTERVQPDSDDTRAYFVLPGPRTLVREGGCWRLIEQDPC